MVSAAKSPLRAMAFVTGAGCLILAAVLGTVTRAVFDAGVFSDRAAAALSDTRVAALVADRVTNALLVERPDLTPVRPLVLATATGLVSSAALRGAVRAAARRAHDTVFSEGSQRVILSIPDVGVLVRGALQHGSPDLAAKIPEAVQAAVAPASGGWVDALFDLSRVGRRLRFAPEAALVLGAILLAAGVCLAADRRRGFVGAGMSLLNSGLLTAGLFVFGRLVLPRLVQDPLLSAATAGLWQTYLGDLLDWSLLLGALGVVIAAGGASLLEGVDPVAMLQAAGRRVAVRPEGRGARLVWSLALVVAGWLAVRHPAVASTAVAVVAGTMLAFFGVRELFRLALDALPEEGPSARGLSAGVLRATVLALLGVVAAAVLLLLVRRQGLSPLPVVERACNGSPVLCERAVSDVAFAATHNSMSNTAVRDWMFPHQQAGIGQQLTDGVRALLIDVHYGFAGAARVKTDLSGPRPTTEALERAVGREGVEAAIRIRDRLVGADEGHRRLYLCHGFCELGAYELVPTLRDVRAFLVTHPDDVIVLVIEDYVQPEDLAAAFEESGLAEFVFRDPAPPWPTLGTLAGTRANLLVFLESGRAGVPWLRPAFVNIQETPYTFHQPTDFDCRPNRGGTAGSLFQVNHWIETTPAPRPSNAAEVNARDVLLSRMERCARERGRQVNVVAVDFYRSGDLLAVVTELNGRGDAARH